MKKSTRYTLRVVIYGGLAVIAGMVLAVHKLVPETDNAPVNLWANYGGLQSGSLSGHYLAGRHAAIRRDYDGALEHITEALEKTPNEPSLLAQAIQLEIMAGDIEKAVPLAMRMDALGEDDQLGTLARVTQHSANGNFAAALQLLEKDMPGTLYSVMRPLFVQWAAIASNPPTIAVSLEKEARKSSILAPFVYYQEAMMNDVLGFDDAVREGFASISENPERLPFRLLEALVNHMVRTGEMEKARDIVAAYQQANPDSGFARMELLLQEDQTALVDGVRDGIAELLFTAASMLMGQEAYSEATAYLQMALALNEKHAPSLFMLASIYEANEQYGKAIATYQRIPDGTPYGERGAIRAVLNLQAMDEIGKAIAEMEKLVKAQPDEQDPLVSLADLYRVDKQYKKAYETYGKAMELAAEPNWALYYARGISYERAKLWEKAEADFVSALSLSPDQPDVLNYLGYSLLEQGERVDDAKEMIKKAVIQRPYDAHIIDSMGWAHYMTGEYEDAVDFLERAAELTPQDPTINDHLGDAYWRVGRKIEARYQWQRALIFDPEEELTQKIQAKLEKGLQPLAKPDQEAATPSGVADSGELSVQ